MYALKAGAWTKIGEGYASDEWEAVGYRSGADETMLMVNGADGMISWDGRSGQAEEIHPTQGGEEISFAHLTLLYERLWGAVHAAAPDRIYWSESFAPEDWEPDAGQPDAGGGFVDVATFDGSRIRAIVAAFDDILIFKDKSMHRLNGTYPGEFSLTQVYGAEGTLAAGTIVHTADRLYFLGMDGLCVYNGMSVATLAHGGDRRMEKIWARMNRGAIGGACAAIYGDVLYLALPLDGAEENSHLLAYGLDDGYWSLMDLSGVRDMLVVREGTGEKLLLLSGRQVLAWGAGDAFPGRAIAAAWLSPVMGMNALTAKRTVGRVCFAAEAQATGEPAGVRLTMISGERERSREIPLADGLNLVRQRIRIRGRTFRFRLENMNGCRLTLPAGLEMILEEDSDL